MRCDCRRQGRARSDPSAACACYTAALKRSSSFERASRPSMIRETCGESLPAGAISSWRLRLSDPGVDPHRRLRRRLHWHGGDDHHPLTEQPALHQSFFMFEERNVDSRKCRRPEWLQNSNLSPSPVGSSRHNVCLNLRGGLARTVRMHGP